MIVEFIGTPGAGKTTLLSVAANYFNQNGFDAYSVVDAARPFAARIIWAKGVRRLPTTWHRPLLWQIFYHLSKIWRLEFFLKNPQLIWMVYRFQRSRPISDLDRRHVLHWFFHHVGTYTFLKAYARPNEALLFDEGFIHRVVQHYASEAEEPNFSHMIAYIDLLPQPDLVIYPVASRELCEQRVYDRGLWDRFRQKTPQEVSRYMTNAHKVVHEAVKHIKSRGWAVIEVNNNNVSETVAAAELVRKLSQLSIFTPKEFTPKESTAVITARNISNL